MATLFAFAICFCVTSKGVTPLVIPDTLERNVNLKEVVVKSKKEKYSKKNNPAVDFVNRLRKTSHINSPSNHENYSYDKYSRLTMALLPFDSTKTSQGNLQFLKEYVIESPISEQSMLPFSVKEKASTVYYSDHGENKKEVVEAIKRNGVDDIVDQEQIEKVMEDFLREIDLYDSEIPLLQNRFVSPLAKIGPDYYMYFLSDTITNDDGSRWIELSFTPRVNTTYGFLGRLYVAEGDSTMFVRNIKLAFPHNININFIDRISIEQTYERAADGTRLKTLDDLQAELKIIPGLPGIFGRRMTRYDNHSFEKPDSTTEILLAGIVGDSFVKEGAITNGTNETFWETVREYDMTVPEKRIDNMMEQLHNVKGYRYIMKGIKILGTGYIPTNADFDRSRFDFGPIFNMVSHNSLEGWRLQIGGMTTSNLSKKWFLDGYVAYGIKDKRWKENLSVEYSFIDKNNHPKNFPVVSLRATYEDDVYYLGQRLNAYGMIFQSLQRNSDNLIAYRRMGSLTYTHERANHLSWSAIASYSRIEASRLFPLYYVNGTKIGHYNTLEGSATIRWAPQEKIYETRRHRFKINDDNIVLGLTLTAGKIYSPLVEYKKVNIEASIWKRFWFSAFGSLSLDIEGGKTFGTVPFPALATLPVNTSYLIVDGTFTLANPMEFLGDLYGKWDVTYNGMGILFNRIPYINKLKVREVVGLRGWWSSLQAKNDPLRNTSVFQFPHEDMIYHMPRPYMELYAGLDNILSILRIDYVWRATYRNVPGCDKWGIRLAIHISF